MIPATLEPKILENGPEPEFLRNFEPSLELNLPTVFSSWDWLLFSSWDWLSIYKVYVYMTFFYLKLNPDIVPIIRFWDSPIIKVTIYVCRLYSTFYTNCQSDKWHYVFLVLPLFSILNFQVAR
jgi:hypothetical protein